MHEAKVLRPDQLDKAQQTPRGQPGRAVLEQDGKWSGPFPSTKRGAFFLYFTRLGAGEFSVEGNALYIYPQKNFAEIQPDICGEFKNPEDLKDKSVTVTDGWIVHRKDWQTEARRVLAMNVVRLG